MSLKAQLYIFGRFFVMQYLSICKLRPIFIGLNAGNGLDFSNNFRGSMPSDPPSIASRLRRLLVHALTKDPTN